MCLKSRLMQWEFSDSTLMMKRYFECYSVKIVYDHKTSILNFKEKTGTAQNIFKYALVAFVRC